MPKPTALTDKQASVLDYLWAFHAEHGYAPSIREVAEHFDSPHPTAALCHLDALEAKGFIRRADNIARGMVLLHKSPTTDR